MLFHYSITVILVVPVQISIADKSAPVDTCKKCSEKQISANNTGSLNVIIIIGITKRLHISPMLERVRVKSSKDPVDE